MIFRYDAKQRPMLPVSLCKQESSVNVEALVDSGADVNVLPWSIGIELGLVWNPNKATLRLAGVSAGAAAMPVLVEATIGSLRPVTLAFAWCESDAVPLVLGQTNFFMEFDICFFRSRLELSVVPKAGRT
ncbi:MAG TPA: hypothetical protein DDZ88_25255 [Verrucomicrobiales bacterium]|nr:hypothetical protein [Verrucomicrobiales bacterium]